jgi:hypothetical protein
MSGSTQATAPDISGHGMSGSTQATAPDIRR